MKPTPRTMRRYAVARLSINQRQAYLKWLVGRTILMAMLRRFLAYRAVCILSAVLVATPLLAQEKSVRPGINNPFKDPDLKEYLQNFERESREIAAHARDIVAACKLKPGMAVADVGAGTGLFTRPFAAAVGEKGKVYAVDIAPTFLRHIEKTCAESKLQNVETIQCDQFSTRLPKNSIDLVFICDTYHHFEFPQRTLQSMHDALRPGGRLILIDFHRVLGKSSLFVLGHVRAGQETFVREITTAGFKVVGAENFLKENYFVRFEKKAAAGAGQGQQQYPSHGRFGSTQMDCMALASFAHTPLLQGGRWQGSSTRGVVEMR
jgi:predicted methyltransferase